MTVTPQKTPAKPTLGNNAVEIEAARNSSTLEWPKNDNAKISMTVSMSCSTDSSQTSSYKSGIFPLFDQTRFTKHGRGGRHKSGSRHSATAKFIKGDRKVKSIFYLKMSKMKLILAIRLQLQHNFFSFSTVHVY